jgi:hypothetical protein
MPINFDSPQDIAKPAIKLDIVSIHMTDTDMKIKMNWIDSDGSVVKSGSMSLTGQDFTDIVTAKVETGQVDKRISKVFKRTVMQKVKSMLNIAGTVADS